MQMKLLLDNQKLAEGFFEDSRLLGVMAPIQDYQFCWHLNNLLGMDFRLNNEIEIQLTKKKRNYFFPVYRLRSTNVFFVPATYNPVL